MPSPKAWKHQGRNCTKTWGLSPREGNHKRRVECSDSKFTHPALDVAITRHLIDAYRGQSERGRSTFERLITTYWKLVQTKSLHAFDVFKCNQATATPAAVMRTEPLIMAMNRWILELQCTHPLRSLMETHSSQSETVSELESRYYVLPRKRFN